MNFLPTQSSFIPRPRKVLIALMQSAPASSTAVARALMSEVFGDNLTIKNPS